MGSGDTEKLYKICETSASQLPSSLPPLDVFRLKKNLPALTQKQRLSGILYCRRSRGILTKMLSNKRRLRWLDRKTLSPHCGGSAEKFEDQDFQARSVRRETVVSRTRSR